MSLMRKQDAQQPQTVMRGPVGYDERAMTSADMMELEADKMRHAANLQRGFELEFAKSQAEYTAAMMGQMGQMGQMGPQMGQQMGPQMGPQVGQQMGGPPMGHSGAMFPGAFQSYSVPGTGAPFLGAGPQPFTMSPYVGGDMMYPQTGQQYTQPNAFYSTPMQHNASAYGSGSRMPASVWGGVDRRCL
eukprot:2808784-Rhodomonas_salina.1